MVKNLQVPIVWCLYKHRSSIIYIYMSNAICTSRKGCTLYIPLGMSTGRIRVGFLKTRIRTRLSNPKPEPEPEPEPDRF